MTSFNDHDHKDVQPQTTASPEELEELDRFDCGLLTLEERGRFLAKLYADGEKRRSLSEMFELELLRRPEMDDLQDAPAGVDDVRTRSAGLKPRWRGNPRVLKALLTVSASICVVCVLYALRPVSAPIDVGRRENAQFATDSSNSAARKTSAEALAPPMLEESAADVAEESLEEEKSAPARDEVQTFNDFAVAPESEDAAASLELSAEPNDDFTARPDGALAGNKKAGSSQTNGFGGPDREGAPMTSMGAAMGAPESFDEAAPMTASASNAATGAMTMGGMGGGFGGAMGGARNGASRPGMGGAMLSSRSRTLSAQPDALPDRFKFSAPFSAAKREEPSEAPTPDLAEIVAREKRRKASKSFDTPEEPTVDYQNSISDDAADVANDDDALAKVVELLYVGEFREARAEWNRLRQSLKDGAAGKTCQGILLFFEGDREAAEQAFLEALDITPDDPIAARNLDFIREPDGKPANSEVADP